MGFNFFNFDEATRMLMLNEVEADIINGSLYKSVRFNEIGEKLYPELLKKAIKEGNEESLAAELKNNNCFKSHEIRKNGVVAVVPVTASQTFADGEFNVFYMRALCKRATRENKKIEVYRAKVVDNPRPDSAQKIGIVVDAGKLLHDLINRSFDKENALNAFLGGPNSGLSLKIVSA